MSCVKTYVVNLRRRDDRRKRMETILPDGLDMTFTSDWVGPFDGQEITAHSIADYRLLPWQIESDNEWWCRPLKRGEIACTLSHVRCWQEAARSEEKHTVFLEDDVELDQDFVAKLHDRLAALDAFDPDWGLLYLGRFHMEPDGPAFEDFMRCGYSHCTFGYVLSRRGLGDVLDAAVETAIVPVDEFLPAMYVDHPRRDVRRLFPARFAAYALEPAIVTQLPKDVASSDTEDSEFVDESFDHLYVTVA